jgi:effector-binding domain-containing protein
MSKKFIVISLAVLILGIYLAMCMMTPAGYRYKNEIKITGPYKMIYVMVNDVKDWTKWNSWKKSDPDLKISLGGRELHIGANFTFESSDLGEGYAEILDAYQDSLISAKIKASKIPNPILFSFQIIPEGTKSVYVNCNARMTGLVPFWKRGMYFGIQKKLDRLFDEDLQGMKTYVENLVSGDFGVEKTIYEGQKYFGKIDMVVNSKIPQFYAKQYPRIYQMLDSLGIEITGPPAGLILDWEAKTGLVAIAAVLPVGVKMKHIPGFSYFEVPRAECLHLKNFGNYTTLRAAHAKLNYIMDNSPYTLGVPIIEEYVTSPSQEPDTSKWLTNVYYLLESAGGYSKTVEKKWTLEDVIKFQEMDRQKDLKNMLKEVK